MKRIFFLLAFALGLFTFTATKAVTYSQPITKGVQLATAFSPILTKKGGVYVDKFFVVLDSMILQFKNNSQKLIILTDLKNELRTRFPEKEQIVGGDSDEHGCLASAGYSRNEEDQECQRPWEHTKESTGTIDSKKSEHSYQAQVLDLVNQERTKAGLSPLVYDIALEKVAQFHAQDMVSKNYFDHTNLEGLSPFQRCEQLFATTCNGENIAYGQTDPKTVMEGWMNSKGHRENILRDYFKSIGVGYDATGNMRVQVFRG